MRKIALFIALLMGCISLQAQEYYINLHQSGQVTYESGVNAVSNMSFQGSYPASLTINDANGTQVFPVTAFDSITFVYHEPPQVGDEVVITYHGNTASIVNPFANDGVSVSANGANVTVNSTRAEVPYIVTGSSSNGSLVINSNADYSLTLSTLSLTSTSTAAINLATNNNVALTLSGESFLADVTSNTLKAAFQVKGNLTMDGDGRLNVTGKAKHGINVDGNFSVNNGWIEIPESDSDGIHVKGDFFWNTGYLNISSGSDGIDVSGNVTINDGEIFINTNADEARGIKVSGICNILLNCELHIFNAGTDSKGIKCDSLMFINGSNIYINNSGDMSKGIKTDRDLTINGGDIQITSSGSTVLETVNEENVPAYCSAIKSDANIIVGGGSFHITLPESNHGGKGISADGNITVTDGYVSIDAHGDGETYIVSGNTTDSYASACISADGNIDISGGEFNLTNTGLDGKGIKCDGFLSMSNGTVDITHSGNTSKGISTDGDISISDGTIVIHSNGSTVVTNNDPSYCTAIRSNANIAISGGDITIDLPSSNKGGKGIKCAGNMTISGNNTINIETHGDGATYTATSGTDTYSSCCLRAEGNMQILSGNITLTSTGKGGKGINVGTKTGNTYSGTYTQGYTNGTGPTLTVSTTGAQVGSSGGGGGWPPPGPGGGGSSSARASAKAIKAGGMVTIYGGTTTVSTTGNGAEGLESKTQINIEGGQHYFKCYDDCINSSGKIFFNGGVTVCFSNGNDAVDSNAGTAGAITIGDGVVFAYTTRGDPEEGFDCDNNSRIRITGTGIGISAGGQQGGGPGGGGSSITITGAVQGYYFHTSSYTFQSGKYYTLSNTSGEGGSNMVTFSFEANCTSKLALITATGMQHGSTYYVKHGSQAPTNPTTAFHGLYLGGTSSASNQAFIFTAQ